VFFRRRRRQSQSQPAGFSIDPPISPFLMDEGRPSQPNAPSSSSARIEDRRQTHSDFLQTGTVVSPYSDNPNIPSFYPMYHKPNLAPSHSRTNSDMGGRDMGGPSGGPSSVLDASVSGNTESAYGGIASDTSDTSVYAAPPVMRSISTAALDPRREALRRARQSEIDRQLRAVAQQMGDLKTGITTENTMQDSVHESRRTRSDDGEIAEMREQMRLMREQIEHLQAQQQSEWAQGLSDEPPPGYGVDVVSVRVRN